MRTIRFHIVGKLASIIACCFAVAACTPALKWDDVEGARSLYAYHNDEDQSGRLDAGTLVADSRILWNVPADQRACVRRELAGPAATISQRYAAAIRTCVPAPDTNLIIASASGGGRKSQAYTLAILQNLEAYGLLTHVDALGSASGGSFATLAYALSFDDDTNRKLGEDGCWDPANGGFWWTNDCINEFNAKNYGWAWLGRRLRPDILFEHAVAYRDSGESLADVIRARFLHDKADGQPLTFRDLNPARPNLFLGATNITADRSYLLPVRLGTHHIRKAGYERYEVPPVEDMKPLDVWHRRDAALNFSMTTRYFNAIKSDLNRYELVRGLVASAAHPGIIDPTTLRNWDAPKGLEKDKPSEDGWPKSSGKITFVHLTDGGVRDNLGVSEMQWAIECQFAGVLKKTGRIGASPQFCDPAMSRMPRPKSVMAFVIDSSGTASSGRDPRKPEQRLAPLGIPLRFESAVDASNVLSYANTTQRGADLATLMGEIGRNGVDATLVDMSLEALDQPQCQPECADWERARKVAREFYGSELENQPIQWLHNSAKNVAVEFEASSAVVRVLRIAADLIVAKRVIELCESPSAAHFPRDSKIRVTCRRIAQIR